jgi:hypothetical protein
MDHDQVKVLNFFFGIPIEEIILMGFLSGAINSDLTGTALINGKLSSSKRYQPLNKNECMY